MSNIRACDVTKETATTPPVLFVSPSEHAKGLIQNQSQQETEKNSVFAEGCKHKAKSAEIQKGFLVTIHSERLFGLDYK